MKPAPDAAATAKLRERIAAGSGRSLHIRTLDTGSCAVCEQEIRLLSAPHYDLHRLGFFFPRAQARGPAAGHRADGARLRGGSPQGLRGDARAKVVVATGACALGGVIAPTRSCTARSARSSRWTCGSPAARRARWPCCRGSAWRWAGSRRRRRASRPSPTRAGTADEPARPAVQRGRRLARRRAGRAAGRVPAAGLLTGAALSALGGVAAVGGRCWSLVYGNTGVVTPGGVAQTITGGPLQLQMTSLAGVFGGAARHRRGGDRWYAPRYHPAGPGHRVYLAAFFWPCSPA